MTRILLLSVYCLLVPVSSRLCLRTAEQKYATELFAKEVPASQTSEYFNYGKTIRRSRQSNENSAISSNATQYKSTSEPKTVLVKKPIPKFMDTGSDEYYQAKMRFPNKVSASIEREDEDFSVDDYDFDVNHDEYAGRGKPLEPRIVSEQRPKPPAEQAPPPPAPGKATAPHKEEKPSVKVAREVVTYKALDEDYYDEFPAGYNSPEKQTKMTINDDTASGESRDSKEEVISHMRTTRSSPFSFGIYMHKLGEKTSDYASRMLSFLPLFPASYFSSDGLNERIATETRGGPIARQLFNRLT